MPLTGDASTPNPGKVEDSHFHLWSDMAIHVGPGFEQGFHSHFAAQICVARDSGIELRSPHCDRPRRYVAVLIPSGAVHQTEFGVSRMQIYLEPFTVVYREILSMVRMDDSGFVPLPAPESGVWPTGEAESLRTAVLDWLRLVNPAGERLPSKMDSRVLRTIEFIEANLDSESVDLRLSRMAAAVGLSPRRLRLLFRRDAGISIKAFRLWARLRRAVSLAARGMDMTTAAHAAGFSDLAHFSRTFRRAFGSTPSAVWVRNESSATCWHVYD